METEVIYSALYIVSCLAVIGVIGVLIYFARKDYQKKSGPLNENPCAEQKMEYSYVTDLSMLKYPVQINGKWTGATIAVPKAFTSTQIEIIARDAVESEGFIKESEIRKVIVVPDKLINFVV